MFQCKPSCSYSFLSITTTAPPLSAGLMIIKSMFLSSVMARASALLMLGRMDGKRTNGPSDGLPFFLRADLLSFAPYSLRWPEPRLVPLD